MSYTAGTLCEIPIKWLTKINKDCNILNMTGSVCYVDLLGFSYLTKKSKEKYFQKIIDKYISNLHENIYNAIKNTNIRYSVMSDSVFLFDEDGCDALIMVLPKIFRNCINSGILLRGGLSHGEYKITKTKLTEVNIYGDAVTRAVKLENSGKGCRIFIDQNIPSQCTVLTYNPNIFKPYRNYTNYSYIDIFDWPLIFESYYYRPSISYDVKYEPTKDLSNLLFENYKLFANLRFSPEFLWNVQTTDGLEHIGASIEYISSLIDKTLRKSKMYKIKKLEMKHNVKIDDVNKAEIIDGECISIDFIKEDNPRSKEILLNMLEYGKRKYLK
jgi:hypothetical protein